MWQRWTGQQLQQRREARRLRGHRVKTVTWSQVAPAAATPSYHDFPGSERSATQLAG